jgi:hypothetical protein
MSRKILTIWSHKLELIWEKYFSAMESTRKQSVLSAGRTLIQTNFNKLSEIKLLFGAIKRIAMDQSSQKSLFLVRLFLVNLKDM